MFRKIVKFFIPKRLFEIIEPWGHWAEAVLANIVYGFPGRGLKVIGVTGTDGKTTTSTMITAMLRNAGYKVGMITTVNIDTGRGPKPNPTRMTSIAAFNFQKQLKIMRRHKVEYLVLETPSFAMAQHRNWGVKYMLAVMTNLTPEHLDYHRTFERYRDAKVKLFRKVARNPQGTLTGVVNAEDPAAANFTAAAPKAITYGIRKGDMIASSIQATPAGSDFTAKYQDRKLQLHINIPGSFNVQNAMAAAGAGIALGLTDLQIVEGLAALDSVDGRMTRVDEGQDFSVIVDYAHTPNALENVLNELKKVTKGRLIAVFGGTGRRDIAKRPLMGQVAGKIADLVVVTDDEPYDEDPAQIRQQVLKGLEKLGKKLGKGVKEIPDRAEAIQYAIKHAKKGDTVVLLGMGHQKVRVTAQGKVSWDEAAQVRKALRAKLER